jgi:alpha,alpha-trehalase
MLDGPISLFSVWPRLARVLAARPGVLFLDFDGTLVSLADHPEIPRLRLGQRALLQRLSQAAGWSVAIISGRALRDVRRRVDVPGLLYVGNHGLEIEGKGFSFRHPGAVAARPDLARLRRQTECAVTGIMGVVLEDKRLSWALHLRRVAPSDRPRVLRTFQKVIGPAAREGRVEVRRGLLIREVLPPLPWDKGAAVRWILARLSTHERPLPIYIGDDLGDEPAFRVLRRGGIPVIVGRRKRTSARYFLRDPEEVDRFIRSLAALGHVPNVRPSRPSSR